MIRSPALLPGFAATAAIAAMLSVPALAADATPTAPDVATRAASSTARHHSPSQHRTAFRHDYRFNAMQGRVDCNGIWCGRQFVLMVGVAY
jgi:hypothetical protein